MTAQDPETFKRTVSGPQSSNIPASYDSVWKASLQTMGKYPLRTYDQETGVIETDFIRGDNVWLPPYKKKYIPGGYRYKINLKLIKVRSSKENYVRVVVLKQPELQRDFFSTPEKIPTDGLEELAIIYRIEREIEINRLISRNKK